MDSADELTRSQINITDHLGSEQNKALLDLIASVPKLEKYKDYFKLASKRGVIELFDVLPITELSTAEILFINGLPYIINPNPISEGGMGKVYKAFDPQLERAVAVKVLKVDFSQSQYFKDVFTREAKVHANERHKNIVDVYQYTENTGSDGSTLADLQNSAVLVMEYINQAEARTLNKVETPEPDRFILIAEQMRDALEYLSNPARRKNYISGEVGNFSLFHADLKPGNILITNKNVVKITDFGISNHAMENTGAGTPSYLSPERLRVEPVDIRSELFSLTTILYELITKIKFFNQNIPKGAAFAEARNVINNNLINLNFEQMGPELEEYCNKYGLDKDKVSAFFKKAWQKNPLDRFQTPSEYFDSLKDAFTTSA